MDSIPNQIYLLSFCLHHRQIAPNKSQNQIAPHSMCVLNIIDQSAATPVVKINNHPGSKFITDEQ